jgi:hypothetical protein
VVDGRAEVDLGETGLRDGVTVLRAELPKGGSELLRGSPFPIVVVEVVVIPLLKYKW